jgi:hypothetical protein
MFSIRDSVEPEDSFGTEDILPISPAAPLTFATPITFDLPSTTSVPTEPSSTNIPTQKSKTPVITKSKAPKRHKTVIGTEEITADEEIWEFPFETPPRTRRSKPIVEPRETKPGKRNSKRAESPVASKPPRRKSMSAIEDDSVSRKSTQWNTIEIDDESPLPRKRKLTKRIEDSDTERIDSPGPDSQEMDEDVVNMEFNNLARLEMQESITVDSAPPKIATRKKFIIAVEVPQRDFRSKTPLQEIAVANILVPDPTPCNATNKVDSPAETTERGTPGDAESGNCEKQEGVIAPLSSMQEKTAVTTSPSKKMNVASILAKSPKRPMYRVGLSRRINVEPLHGYLKRNVS